MRINFNDIEISELQNYKDGIGKTYSKIVLEGNKKIMLHTIKKGCSIGFHTHENCSEMIFILNGNPTIIENDGLSYVASRNEVIILKPGEGHAIKNDTDEDVEIFTVVYK